MKTIVFTLFLVHSSWPFNWCPTQCGCKSDYKYDLDVTLKRGETVCGRKSPIKEGWDVDNKKDHFKCYQRIGTDDIPMYNTLDQPNAKTFNEDKDGKSRTPTTGTYRICLYIKCVELKQCTVTLTKNGSGDELLRLSDLNSISPTYSCIRIELKNTDKVQVNLISTDDEACLDTGDKANNRLTIELMEKTKGEP